VGAEQGTAGIGSPDRGDAENDGTQERRVFTILIREQMMYELGSLSSQRQLKLHATQGPWQELPIYEPKTLAIATVARTHDRNSRRVFGLSVFPAVVVNAVQAMNASVKRAELECHEAIKAGANISQEEFRARVARAMDEDTDLRERVIKHGGPEAQQLLQDELQRGFNVLNSMLSTHLSEAGDAWLSAQVTGTWTTFEVLAEEVWQAALNAHPQGLAELTGGRKGAGKDKSVSLWLLQKYRYDLSSNMGTVLKDKYSFDRLEGIREAYTDAGIDGDPGIKQAISNRSLDALSIVRNIIVHNGSIADGEYVKRHADLPESLRVGLDNPVVLDGEIVSDLVKPVVRLSYNLMAAVDAWLASRSVPLKPTALKEGAE
jgi:hypothetical protein